MRKATFLLLFLATTSLVVAQDTTALRMVSLGAWPAEVVYLADDSTIMYHQPVQNVDPSNSTSHGFYLDPVTGQLMAVIDSANFMSRDFHQLNPLTGNTSFVMAGGRQWSSIEITDSGRVFGVTGQGDPTPAAVYEIDPANGTTTFRYNTGAPASNPLALLFNPATQELLVTASFADTVYKTQLNNWGTVTPQFVDFQGEEVHGGMYTNGEFLLSVYSGNVLRWNPSSSLISVANIPTTGFHMDLVELKLIDADSIVKVCANDSVAISSMYSSTAYQWYYNGTPVSNSNSQSIMVSDTGAYQLLVEIGGSGNYIWSETIMVEHLNIPLVALSANDTLICPGDSAILTATGGGSSQWYYNGNPIAGATANQYTAHATGLYNMLKTNMNGCSDSSAVGITIYADAPANCNPVAVAEHGLDVNVFPNPFNESITMQFGAAVTGAVLYDATGRTVLTLPAGTQSYTASTSTLTPGVYVLMVTTETGISSYKLVK